MVDVEQSSLGALQQHGLAGFECVVEQQSGIGDPMREALGLSQQSLDDVIGIERLAVVDLDQHLVLELARGRDLGGQQVRVEHVGGADTHPGNLVLITRPDTASGGADLFAAHIALGHLVDGDVVGHQQVRIGGDQQPRGVDAPLVEPAQFGEQHTGVDDDAVADHVGHPGRQDARRNQVQRKVLPGRQNYGVPGVIAALVAHHPLNTTTE